jgi:hypothetical protein
MPRPQVLIHHQAKKFCKRKIPNNRSRLGFNFLVKDGSPFTRFCTRGGPEVLGLSPHVIFKVLLIILNKRKIPNNRSRLGFNFLVKGGSPFTRFCTRGGPEVLGLSPHVIFKVLLIILNKRKIPNNRSRLGFNFLVKGGSPFTRFSKTKNPDGKVRVSYSRRDLNFFGLIRLDSDKKPTKPFKI